MKRQAVWQICETNSTKNMNPQFKDVRLNGWMMMMEASVY